MQNSPEDNTIYSERFRPVFLAIERKVEELKGKEMTGKLKDIFDALDDEILKQIGKQFSELQDQVSNKVEAETGIDLIRKGLHTAEDTAELIQRFLNDNNLLDKTEDEIREIIIRFVRQMLNMNVMFTYLNGLLPKRRDDFGDIIEDTGMEFKDDILQIKENSYLHTAEVLSKYFESEDNISKFKALANSYKSLDYNSEEDKFWTELLTQMITCVEPDIAEELRESYLQSLRELKVSSLSELLEEDNMDKNQIHNQFQLNFYNELIPFTSLSKSYLRITDQTIANLDSILKNSPLKDKILELISQNRFYPTIFNLEHLVVTQGCPAYFHQIALKYVSAGLSAFNQNN